MNSLEIETPVTTKIPSRHRLAKTVVLLLWLWALLVALAGWGPWVELASHFVAHGWLAGVLVILRLAWSRHWRLIGWTIPPTIYFLLLLQPWYLWQTPAGAGDSYQRKLQVMSWNVLCVNEHLDEIQRVIEGQSVDVLVLIEVRPNLFEQIPALRQRYKHCLAFPSWAGNGIAVLTNRDDIELSRLDFAGSIMPSIEVSVEQAQMKLIAMHTWSPMPPSRALPRDQQLEALKLWTRQQSSPICVTGDLNITPWAPAFARLIDLGFVDSRTRGFGNLASWPSWLGPLGIPIDHALTYGPCAITSRRLGPLVWGSDHRPILFEVAY